MDLILVPTEKLIEEIRKRLDGSIIAIEILHNGQHHSNCYYSGGVSVALGLLEKFKHRLLWQELPPNEESCEEII